MRETERGVSPTETVYIKYVMKRQKKALILKGHKRASDLPDAVVGSWPRASDNTAVMAPAGQSYGTWRRYLRWTGE
jgi:hypothetical protein